MLYLGHSQGFDDVEDPSEDFDRKFGVILGVLEFDPDHQFFIDGVEAFR